MAKYMWGRIMGVLLVILVLAFLVFYFFLGGRALLSPQNENSYQAVFLTNGQVYFGKFSTRGQWFVIKDVYYLKTTSALQADGTSADAASLSDSQKKIELVKLGAELHGPEDAIYLEKDKVLFWENMSSSSKVLAAINQYKQGGN